MDTLNTIVIEPTEPIGGLVIWLHGLGASGHDFEPIVPHLGLPRVRFVFPHAPEIPVTLNGGYVMPAWYDIRTLAPGPEREDVAGLRRSSDQIEALIQREIARGAPEDKVVIAGFSQGGAVALDLLTRPTRKVHLGIALSTYLVGVTDTTSSPDALQFSDANATTPVWFGHGRFDDVVPMARGRAAHDTLAALGRPVTWNTYAMGHEVNGPELRDLRQLLQAAF